MDCDGDYDVFVGDTTSDPEPVPNHLFINDGGGTFVAEDDRLPPMPTSIPGAVFCDLDRDGDPDLVWSGGGGPGLSIGPLVSLNDGLGYFDAWEVNLPAEDQQSFRYRCEDLNLDGFPDLIISNEVAVFPLRPEIFLNNGDMTFEDATANLLPPGISNWPMLDKGVVDLNGDGWPDIILEGNPDPSSVLWNTGGGMFVQEFLPGGICYCGGYISIADFDGDGRLDIHWDFNSEFDPNNKNFIMWNR